MKHFLWLILIWAFQQTAVAVEPSTVPACLTYPTDESAWIIKTVHDTPPVGGYIKVLVCKPPRYVENDKVGRIYIIDAVVSVASEKGDIENDVMFLVYDVNTEKGDIRVAFKVDDEHLQEWIDAMTPKSVFNMPTHPPYSRLSILMPTHPPRAGLAFTMPTHPPLAILMPTHPPYV